MAIIKPFKCVRPSVEMASTIAALPYDVYNRKEAKEVVSKNGKSFLAIDRPETGLADDADMYAPEVYQRANQMLQEWIQAGDFQQDEENAYYLYELTMNGRTQTGIVACASIDDYLNSVIKKHENTRAEKEVDRIHHVDGCSAQTGPIFLAYRANETLTKLVALIKEEQPLYDFVSEDGIRHRVFKIAQEKDCKTVEETFASINQIYIADGHHRAASAVKVGLKRRENYPEYTGAEEFNYFMSVLFPGEELMIMDYNRVVKDLNGLSEAAFLEKVKSVFDVVEADAQTAPKKKAEFTMFLSGKWYVCTVKESDIPNDPVESLDVSLLQNLFLSPVLGIEDPKTDSRIDFVGGIRGLDELERRCATDCKVAFAMYPTSIEELFDVADASLLMPPKSTWFEPKLRSGLFIHQFER